MASHRDLSCMGDIRARDGHLCNTMAPIQAIAFRFPAYSREPRSALTRPFNSAPGSPGGPHVQADHRRFFVELDSLFPLSFFSRIPGIGLTHYCATIGLTHDPWFGPDGVAAGLRREEERRAAYHAALMED